MAKEKPVIEDVLLEELEKETEPHAAFRAGKKELQKGTAAVRAKADYTTEVKGPELIERAEAYATDLYTAMGRSGNQDPKMLAYNLKRALGDKYSPFLSALKVGDVDTANQLTRAAYEEEVGNAKLESIIQKLGQLPPDSRIRFGRKVVRGLGTDYFKAAAEPGILVQSLTDQKRIAERYK